jgi:hypothetical protein
VAGDVEARIGFPKNEIVFDDPSNAVIKMKDIGVWSTVATEFYRHGKLIAKYHCRDGLALERNDSELPDALFIMAASRHTYIAQKNYSARDHLD